MPQSTPVTTHVATPAATPAAAGTNAPAAASSSDESGSVPANYSSLTELKNTAPKVYNMMMMTIAQSICGQMQQQSNTLTQMIKEGEDSPY